MTSRFISILAHVCRSLLRSWGMNLLNIIGLAIGFSAAMVIGMYVRNELRFDHFFPTVDQLYIVKTVYSPPNSPLVSNDKSPAGLAAWLRTDSNAIDSVARIHPVEWSVRSPRLESLEYFYWADPNLFDLLQIKAASGNLKTALDRPYTMVLTQRMAQRYFGSDDVVGKTLYINGTSPVEITAVLDDFPSNTSLNREIFVSSRSSYSMLAVLDNKPDWQWSSSYTFIRLKLGHSLSPDAVKNIAIKNWHSKFNLPYKFEVVPLTKLHFQPEADSQIAPRGHRDTVMAMAVVAGVILFLAIINFSGLVTTQIDERYSEMAVRRSLGAQAHNLFFHVIAEVLLINVLAVITGLALAERLLPTVNSLLDLQIYLWATPDYVIYFSMVSVLIGTIGGIYPAYVLSHTVCGQKRYTHTVIERGSYLNRVGWITVQFTLLITLLISSQVVYKQWEFATRKALNFDTDRVLQISVFNHGPIDEGFKQRLIALPGVSDAAFSRFTPIEKDIRPAWAKSPTNQPIQLYRQSVDTDFFSLFKVRIIEGRNFSKIYLSNTPPQEIILNRSAAKALGYSAPRDAIGRVLEYNADQKQVRSIIIGVVDDIRINSVREPTQPLIFDNQSFFFTRLNVKLRPQHEAATLAAIDEIWKLHYPSINPIDRYYYSEYLNDVYQDMSKLWWTFALLSAVGICVSVLGMSSLSIYLARTRKREIAIRNALGARSKDIIRLQLEPFVKPLLIANLAAGLMSWGLMSWWLSSFDSHVTLTFDVFIAAGGITILIALITMAVNILVTSHARRSLMLRAN